MAAEALAVPANEPARVPLCSVRLQQRTKTKQLYEQSDASRSQPSKLSFSNLHSAFTTCIANHIPRESQYAVPFRSHSQSQSETSRTWFTHTWPKAPRERKSTARLLPSAHTGLPKLAGRMGNEPYGRIPYDDIGSG